MNNLLIPFSENAKKQTLALNIDFNNLNPEILVLIKSTFIKIMKEEFVFPKTEEKYLQEYFALYPLARIILSIINKEKFYSSFSNFYYAELKKEILDPKEYLELLSINYSVNLDNFLIPFEEYIKAKIYSEKDKLTNQYVYNGFVYLDKTKIINFIARYVASKVLENLPFSIAGVPEQLTKIANELDEMFKPKIKKYDLNIKSVNTNNFPPCMQKIMQEMLEHGAPNHMARFYFATFLFTLKMDFDSVLNIYKESSDYDERIAKYQLERVQKYSCPNCDTIKSMGLCFPDDFCQNIKSPFGYYLKKTFNKDEN